MSAPNLSSEEEIGQLKAKITQLEAKLKAKEAPLKGTTAVASPIFQDRLFQANYFPMVLYDFDQEQIVDCNNQAPALYGYERKEEILGMSHRQFIPRFSEYFPGYDNYFAVEQHAERVRRGEVFQSVGVLIRKDESHLLLNMTIVPVYPDQGMAFIMLEKGDHKRTSEKLMEKNENSYRHLFENSYEGIVYYDVLEQRVLDCNQKALDLYGFKTKQELIETPPYVLYAGSRQEGKDIQKKLIKMMEKVFSNGQAVTSHWAKKITGEEFRIRTNAILENSSRNHPRCLFFIRDITTEYLAEREKTRLINELEQIINTMPASLMIKDEFGKVIRSNRVEMAVSRGRVEVEERPFVDTQCELDQKRYLQRELEVIKTGEAQIGVVEKIENNLGVDCWMRSDKIPYRNEDGEVKGVMIYSVDVTEMVETQEKIEVQNEELKRYVDSNNQLENFAYIASHDLQAPLRSIISFTQLLNRSFKNQLADNQKDYIDFIISAGKNMQELITSLLVYSRVKKTDQQIEAIDTLDLLQTIRRELVSVIKEKEAIIEFENIPTTIKGDVINLRQLFQNLITNALKFVESGVAPEIWIRGKETSTHWQFAVSDNGIGIARENQAGIFTLFHRLHGKSEYEGSGIGLALCQKIVHLHKGEIWLDSKAGQGTTFHFTISKKIGAAKVH